MSGNEYSFQAQQKRSFIATGNFNDMNSGNNNKVVDLSSQMPSNVRGIILGQYDKFIDMKSKNGKIKYLIESQDRLSKEILSSFGLLQKSESSEMTNLINQKLNNLSMLHQKVKVECDEILKVELSILYENWPDIYDKVIEGVDRETLSHVLSVYEEFRKGNLSSNEAVSEGMNFLTDKYELPNDFFNHNGIEKFNAEIGLQNNGKFN